MSEPLFLLAERSLIQVEGSRANSQDTLPRYRMLESLREFADEQLSPRERESLLLRHGRYFEALSRMADQLGQGGGRTAIQADLLMSQGANALNFGRLRIGDSIGEAYFRSTEKIANGQIMHFSIKGDVL